MVAKEFSSYTSFFALLPHYSNAWNRLWYPGSRGPFSIYLKYEINRSYGIDKEKISSGTQGKAMGALFQVYRISIYTCWSVNGVLASTEERGVDNCWSVPF